MKTETYINEFIDREKQTEHSPFLATRIMSGIEAVVAEPAFRKILLWQKLAVAASFLLVVASGVAVGNKFTPKSDSYAELNVNDSQIENFTFYNAENNE